jgi:hypothetical protein
MDDTKTRYQQFLDFIKRRFHGGQTPGEIYKRPPVYHSLGARGGPHDANGNRLDKNGRVVGRDGAFYPVGNSINHYTGKPVGTWLK